MDVHRHELARIAVGLEGKGAVGHRLGKIDLPEDIPGLAGIARAVLRDAFFERRHDAVSLKVSPTLPAALQLSSTRGFGHWAISCQSLKSKIYAGLHVNGPIWEGC